jgi:voltage-gated potassium channel
VPHPDHVSVEASLVGQLQAEIHRHLSPYRHTALLAALIGAFLVRPFTGDSGAGPPLYSVAVMLLLVLALYNLHFVELPDDRETLRVRRSRRSIIAWTLGVTAVAQRLLDSFAHRPALFRAGSILWLMLFGYITWNHLRAVLKQKEITREVLSMSISTYLLIGFTCGLFYLVLFDLQPNSFSFGTAGPPMPQQQAVPLLIYFSLTTLSTIGFGDIDPLTLQARYVAVAEGIAGQFYLAILVARLVGMQMSQAASPHAEPEGDNPETRSDG